MSLWRKAQLFFAAVLTAAMMPAMVSAAVDPFKDICTGSGSSSSVCQGDGSDPIAGPNGAILSVTSILALVAGIVSIIFLVYGGMKYVTSGGDSAGVSSAKNTIIAALVGLLIAALARPIVAFVIGKL